MTVAFLFPGQGSQREGLLHALPRHAAVAATLAEAAQVLGDGIALLDTAEALRSTAVVQQVLLIAGVATSRALTAEGIAPAVVAGMSIGAFGAAVACGALHFGDALRLVHLRGELMQAAFPSGYGLTAIEGLDESTVEDIVVGVRRSGGPAYVSNVNAPRQIVVAGSEAALLAVAEEAKRRGARRARRLEVAVPSHSPLMQPVADRLRQALSALELRTPAVPYMSDAGGRALYDPERIREDLATSVAQPVRWSAALEVMRELGVGVFLEMPPGHVSTDLVIQQLPDVHAVAISEQGLHHAVVVAASAGDQEGRSIPPA